MIKKFKKLFSAVLVAAMAVALMPMNSVSVFAASNPTASQVCTMKAEDPSLEGDCTYGNNDYWRSNVYRCTWHCSNTKHKIQREGYAEEGMFEPDHVLGVACPYCGMLPYEISFNTNGGSGGKMSERKEAGSSFELPACTFTAPAGKVFDGWATSATGSKLTGTSITISGNTTLYALWKEEGGSGPEVINPSSLAVAVTLPTTGSSISNEGELFPGATFSYNTDLVNSVQSAYGFFSDYENEVIATTIEAGSTYTVYIGLAAEAENEHPFTTEDSKNLTEDETKAYFSSLPSEFTFVSGTLKPARFVAIFTYTVGNPGSGSNPDPKPTPSKSEAAAPPTIPTDYVAERVAEEEAMEVTIVTIDTTQYSKNEETVVPGTSYNLSKFITTKGIVKGIKTAVVAANNAKKDTVEIYTGKPFCFNKEIIKTIQESKKTVVYYFQYKGHIYSVTVPATVDASKVLEKAGFAGPLYVGQQLGTTKLVK